MAGEVPLAVPEEVIESEGYKEWKQDSLKRLEPSRPVNPRQRFDNQDTHFDNPNVEPGIVRFRTEAGETFKPDLIGEAQTVQRSREHLLLGGQITDLRTKQDQIKDELTEKAEQGWRGTEFDDLQGVGRSLSAIPNQSARVVNRDLLMLTTGDDFKRVAETALTLSITVPEGNRVRGRIICPEDVVEIINTVLAKAHLSGNWTSQTIIKDLDVLRELIEKDLVLPESVDVKRSFTLRPDVLPDERTPKPQKPAEE